MTLFDSRRGLSAGNGYSSNTYSRPPRLTVLKVSISADSSIMEPRDVFITFWIAKCSQNWYRILNYALEKDGEDRIVFGMDFPAYNPGPEISKVRDADVTEAQKQKIMGENAARILGL